MARRSLAHLTLPAWFRVLRPYRLGLWPRLVPCRGTLIQPMAENSAPCLNQPGKESRSIHRPGFRPPKHRKHWGTARTIRDEGGFTYLMAMFFVVLIGISLMMVGQQWSVTMKRDREEELRFRGSRIQRAIERYAADYEVQKSTRSNRYPLKLEDLTKKPKRYLQVVYKDPITGKDFALIKTGTEIRGVRSTSEETPYDQVHFKGAKTYSAIRFEATSATTTPCTPNPINPLLTQKCEQPSSTPQGSSKGSGQHPPHQGDSSPENSAAP